MKKTCQTRQQVVQGDLSRGGRREDDPVHDKREVSVDSNAKESDEKRDASQHSNVENSDELIEDASDSGEREEASGDCNAGFSLEPLPVELLEKIIGYALEGDLSFLNVLNRVSQRFKNISSSFNTLLHISDYVGNAFGLSGAVNIVLRIMGYPMFIYLHITYYTNLQLIQYP